MVEVFIMSNSLQFVVAIPPSVNKIWRKSRNGGMHRSQNYARWIAETRLMLNLLEPLQDGTYAVVITIHGGIGWRSNRDIDNVPKGILDAMVLAGILPDDNCEIVQRVHVEYRPAADKKSKAFCAVRVTPYEDFSYIVRGLTGD